jgi:MoaA/NifB/PqqE/SkfB family radical SAM enzyme
MNIKTLQNISNKKLFKVFAFWAACLSHLMPSYGKSKKYKNFLKTLYSVSSKKCIIRSNPVSVRIAPVNVCNYECLFCEIHKDNLLFPDRPLNSIGLDTIKKYESFLSTTYKLYFCGGSAEPLLNKSFGKIVEYLKSKYNTRMGVNTNASNLTNNLADIFVDKGFDSILVSYHAGTSNGYEKLMGGNIKIVDENLKYLRERKQRSSKRKPHVQLNFALHKANANEYSFIIDKAKQLGAGEVILSRYYGGRNKLQDKQVAFDYDVKSGNELLDKIYKYAEDKGVKLIPPKPFYWVEKQQQWEPESFDACAKCILPWTNLYFDPVLDDKNCHYAGVCTRIELFKIDYSKADFSTQDNFNLLWNHPVLQYLRSTVNSEKNINPVCKYCKNHTKEVLRNVDQNLYSRIRDNAVEEFFRQFRKNYSYKETQGIEVLWDNPYSDQKFREKLSKLQEK